MQTLDDILDLGCRLIDNFKYEEAIEYFSKATELYPTDPNAYDFKGVALFGLLKIENAIIELNRALTCDPLFHLAYFHLAEVSMEQSNFKSADNFCNQALKIESENELYQSTSAYIKLQLHENEKCIEICNQVLNLNPSNIFATEYRAIAYMNQNKFENAITDFEHLYANTMVNSIILNNLGYAYSKVGNITISKKYLKSAIDFDPNYSYPYDNLGYVYMLEGDFKKAHQLIDKSIELDPTNSYAFKNKALVFLKQNDILNTILYLEKAKALRFDLYYGSEVEDLLTKLRSAE